MKNYNDVIRKIEKLSMVINSLNMESKYLNIKILNAINPLLVKNESERLKEINEELKLNNEKIKILKWILE